MSAPAITVPVLLSVTVALAGAAAASQPLRAPIAAAPADASARKAEKVHQEFDAVMLQAMISPMLASGKSGPLGSGSAGRYWQSMMAEHLARHLAASGRLRLLQRPAKAARGSMAARPIPNLQTHTRAAQSPPRVQAGSWRTTVDPAGVSDDGASPQRVSMPAGKE